MRDTSYIYTHIHTYMYDLYIHVFSKYIEMYHINVCDMYACARERERDNNSLCCAHSCIYMHMRAYVPQTYLGHSSMEKQKGADVMQTLSASGQEPSWRPCWPSPRNARTVTLFSKGTRHCLPTADHTPTSHVFFLFCSAPACVVIVGACEQVGGV
jgi:hypothetical protein